MASMGLCKSAESSVLQFFPPSTSNLSICLLPWHSFHFHTLLLSRLHAGIHILPHPRASHCFSCLRMKNDMRVFIFLPCFPVSFPLDSCTWHVGIDSDQTVSKWDLQKLRKRSHDMTRSYKCPRLLWVNNFHVCCYTAIMQLGVAFVFNAIWESLRTSTNVMLRNQGQHDKRCCQGKYLHMIWMDIGFVWTPCLCF